MGVDAGENQEDPSLEVIVFFRSLIHILAALLITAKWCQCHTSPAPFAVMHTKHDDPLNMLNLYILIFHTLQKQYFSVL